MSPLGPIEFLGALFPVKIRGKTISICVGTGPAYLKTSSMSVFPGDRIVCGRVGGHFSLRVAWVSSPPTYLQTINIFDSSEFYVKFSTFRCEEPSMLIVCGWVGGALFMLPAVVFGPPTHLHTFSSFGFSKTCLF